MAGAVESRVARPLQFRCSLQRSAVARLVIFSALQQEIAVVVPSQPQ